MPSKREKSIGQINPKRKKGKLLREAKIPQHRQGWRGQRQIRNAESWAAETTQQHEAWPEEDYVACPIKGNIDTVQF